jgi:nitrate/nitrite-specific signal transduction histidine kinase
MAKDQRKVINYLKTSGLRRSYYLHIFAGGVAFLGIIVIYVSHLLAEVQNAVATIPDVELSTFAQDRLLAVAVLFFICFLGFLISTVFYMIVLGHRVGGPVVAICNYIQALKAGKYDAPRSLRKNDELVSIMNELNELAEILRKKKA